MDNLTKSIANALIEKINAKKISKSEVCRVAGVNRPLLDRYLAGDIPGLGHLESIIAALDLEPWELVKPPGAVEKQSPTLEGLQAVIASQEARIQELEAKLKAMEPSPDLAAKIDDAMRQADEIEALFQKGKRKHK